jgi:16S rRNA (guanine527-N7)-methyltransferase
VSAPALLARGLNALSLPPALAAPLDAYLAELEKWNGAYNLTAVRDRTEMVTRHVLDSLAIAPVIARLAQEIAAPTPLRLLDVGSGAGLPGIPLAIAHPAWHITLLDSNGKKARFQRHAQRTLGLTNVEVVEARVESWQAPQPFPLIVSRAFASLAVGGTAHLLAGNGRWLAMKGKVADSELESLPSGIALEHHFPLTVPGLREARSLLVLRKQL